MKLRRFLLFLSLLIGAPLNAAQIVEFIPMHDDHPCASAMDQPTSYYLKKYLRASVVKTFEEASAILGHPADWIGLPESSAALLKELGIIEEYHYETTSYGNHYLKFTLAADFDPIELAIKLNRYSKSLYAKTYSKGSATEFPYSRLVFQFRNYDLKLKGKDWPSDEASFKKIEEYFIGNVFWDPDTDQFFDAQGRPLRESQLGLLAGTGEHTGTMDSEDFFDLVPQGLSPLDPKFPRHDAFGHFVSSLTHIELEPLRRSQYSRTSQKLRELRLHKNARVIVDYQFRPILIDEYGWFYITDEVVPFIQKIGSFVLPQEKLSSNEFHILLSDALKEGKFSRAELEAFSQTLIENRQHFFDRYGGASADGYNDSLEAPVFTVSPYHALGKIADIRRRGYSDAKVTLLLSIVLAAAQSRIPMRQFIEFGPLITPQNQAAYLNSEVFRFFKKVYGDTTLRPNPTRNLMIEFQGEHPGESSLE